MNSVIPQEIASSSTPVALFGYARPRRGRETELQQTLLSFVGPTRGENGALAYQVHADPEQPGVIAFYEQWASGEDLSRHLQRPEMQTFLSRRMDLLSTDLEIRFFRPLEP